jgi:exo-beta-1,3-glucanase (GH17 family)
MGCGCNKRAKQAVTSVNVAQESLGMNPEEAAAHDLEQRMASLRAAVHNSQSEVVVATE